MVFINVYKRLQTCQNPPFLEKARTIGKYQAKWLKVDLKGGGVPHIYIYIFIYLAPPQKTEKNCLKKRPPNMPKNFVNTSKKCKQVGFFFLGGTIYLYIYIYCALLKVMDPTSNEARIR